MIPASNRLTPSTANRLGQQVFELILDNWGNRSATADTNLRSLIYPASADDEPLPTVCGIAIAPRSDIDRVAVTYEVNPLAAITETFNVFQGTLLTNDQIISVDRPWYGEMDAGSLFIAPTLLPAPLPSKNLKSLFVHCARDQQFGDTYFKSGEVNPRDWPSDPVGINPPPTLRLLLFLNGQAPSPFRRSPAALQINMGEPAVSGQPSAVFKVMGRRRIRITLKAQTTGDVSFVLGGVRGGALQATTPSMWEYTLANTTTLSAGEDTTLTFDDPLIDYVTFYMTLAGGSTGTVRVMADAVD